MKNNKKEIEITKNNYKEYVELYKIMMFGRTSELIKVMIPATFIFSILTIGTVSLVSNIIQYATLSAAYISLIGYGINKYKNNYYKKQKEEFKKNHPNTDINIDIKIEELTESLEKINIIKLKYENGYPIKYVDLSEFESKIRQEEYIEKCEKTKKQIFEKYRYDYSPLEFDNSLSTQELEKAKVKVKSLSRTNFNNK